MLHFFYTYHQLPAVKTPAATPFKIFSAEKYRGKVIPFSHSYVTSDPYLRKIKKSLGEEYADKLNVMNTSQVKALKSHANFPIELTRLGEGAVDVIKADFSEKSTINIVVVNGVGTGFGDNYVGLGAMQRLTELLSPLRVNFHLMQTMNERAATVYMREENIFLYNNCLKLKKFLQMDFYVNLTGMLGFDAFEQLPLARFMAQSFMVDECSSIEELQPTLTLDPYKLLSIKRAMSVAFDSKKPIVLFHPQASSPVRTMKKGVADTLITALIAHGFHVVSAIPYTFNAKEFVSLDELSSDVDDLVHITRCSDAVVSVGTVLYHLAAALRKPTILLPSVKADVESGSILPTVTAWVPQQSVNLIIDKHKSREEQDLKIAEKIWANIDPMRLASELKQRLKIGESEAKIIL